MSGSSQHGADLKNLLGKTSGSFAAAKPRDRPLSGRAETWVPLRKLTLAARRRASEGCVGQAVIESENAYRIVTQAAKLEKLAAIRNRQFWI
jgi:hypothetical protein